MSCNCSLTPESELFNTEPTKLRVLDYHHRVGCTVPLQKTLYSTLSQPSSEGCHVVQFYLGGRQNYSCRTLSSEDKKKSLEYCDKWNKSFYIHCPLIANLSKEPNTAYIPTSILSRSATVVDKELQQIKDLPGSCVLHTGARGTIENVIANINDMKIDRGTHHRNEKQLLLENSSGNGTKLGRTWEEYRKIYEGLDNNTVGFCLDTQHIFGAGQTDFEDHESVIKMFDECIDAYGRNPDAIHLNDSKVLHNSLHDRHENIGQGYIWNSNDESLKSLLNYCYDNDIDVILETPNQAEDIENIRSKYMDLEIIDVVKIE